MKDINDLDVLPPTVSLNYLDIVEEVAKWSYFHFMPKFKKFYKGMLEISPDLYSKTLQDLQPKKQQSLLSYYYLLPKWARDHPAIKMVVQNLEYTKAYTTSREKQLMINMGL